MAKFWLSEKLETCGEESIVVPIFLLVVVDKKDHQDNVIMTIRNPGVLSVESDSI